MNLRRQFLVGLLIITTVSLIYSPLVTGLTPNAYAAHPSGPLAFWDFEDASDPTSDTSHTANCDINDFGGSGASFNGFGIANEGSNSLEFDGVDDYCDAADPGGANNLDGLSGLTLSAWIKRDTIDTDNETIISKYNTQTDYISYYMSILDDEVGLFVAKDSSNWAFIETTTSPISVDTVHHVVGTWDGSSLKIYVDGALQTSTPTTTGTFPTTMLDSGVNVSIGSAVSSAGGFRIGFFDGTIDDVKIFNNPSILQPITEPINIAELITTLLLQPLLQPITEPINIAELVSHQLLQPLLQPITEPINIAELVSQILDLWLFQ